MAVLSDFFTALDTYYTSFESDLGENWQEAENKRRTIETLQGTYQRFNLLGRDSEYTNALAEYVVMLDLLDVADDSPARDVTVTDLVTFFSTSGGTFTQYWEVDGDSLQPIVGTEINVDTISEKTSGSGVAVDSVTFKDGGITLATGGAVNEIETTITDDDTHIPTSGAVVDYVESNALQDIEEDTSPKLGGNLDLDSNKVGDATTADITKLSELTASSIELNYVDGVTSAIQTQLNAKSTASKTETLTNKTIDADGTGNTISNIEDANIKAAAGIDASKIADGSVSDAEFQRLDGLTADIQGQIDAKAPLDATILSKSGAYELVAGDAGKIVECDGTFTVTLPDSMDTGYQVTIVNVGSGTITIAASTTLQTKDSDTQLQDQYAAASAYHRGSDVWIAFGDLKSA